MCHARLPGLTGRKEGMTLSQRGPLMPWATHMIQWMKQWVAKPRGGANPIKYILNSDWRLQLASMKPESLVIADQHAAVNTFSNFALTARQLREAGNTRSTILLCGTTVGSVTKTKSKQGPGRRTCSWLTSFLFE